MPERKLASIRKVSEIIPIEKADNIELAKIDGWQCVVGKGQFKPGDFGVYFEIDSFLPIDPRFEFLRSKCYKKNGNEEGFKIKTVKMKGVLSQGLLMPISEFNELDFVKIEQGVDCTDLLKVKKFDPPLPVHLMGQAKGNWPSFLRKTDEERIQNLPEYFNSDFFKGVSFEVTEKIDGTSCTIFYKDGEFGVCSRNIYLKESDFNVYWQIAKRFKLLDILKKKRENVAIQGEIAGPGIGKNNLGLEKLSFFVFNIWNIDKQRYFLPMERYKFLEEVDLEHVPIIEENFAVFEQFNDIKLILEYASGNSMINKDKMREGLVFKSNLLYNGQIISFKAINNQYLLKNEK